MPESNNWLDDTSRRDVLRYGAAGGVALAAGCMGGGSESTGRTFNVFDPTTGGTAPANRHLNPWNPTQSGCWHPGANIFDRAVVHSPASNEGYSIIAQEWEMVEDTTMEFRLSDEFTWHNGDQVTAQDWALQFDIALGILAMQAEDGGRPHPLVESAEAVDETTLHVNFHDALDESWALQNATADLAGREGRGIFTKSGEEPWEGWKTRLDEEDNSVLQEITTSSEPALSEDTVGNGAFQVSEIGDATVVMEVYEDHPHSGNIDLKEYRLDLYESGKPTQPYSAQEVDAAHTGFPVQEDLQGRMPEGHTLFRETLSSNKLFAFNCGHGHNYDTPFEDVRVRKAVCHVFDREELPRLLQGVNRPFEWGPCRVPGNILAEGDHPAAEWVKDFTLYGQNDTERATELLTDAGYQRDDGNWYRPNGDRFEINWMSGIERPDHQILIQNLKDFGVAIKQEQVDSATLDERRSAGDYHVMPDGSSANGITAMWTLDLVPNWIQSITHYQPERDIPMPVGDPDGGDGTKTINVENHIRQWQITGDEQYHKELMWWWNQTLPEMEAMFQPDAGAYDGGNWEIDAQDSIINGVDDALYIAPKMEDGTIRYVGGE
ncbi:ABC transporter substrate-binding protein [Natrinema sp. DC36]|uniref:ABC transporter substrate-binding protein n=1 Tax=Natrinema sp. DC36 TaxID=2878680 RepID=UPI001CEFF541|nr:ABC transporter substrate-binding protein [Natrinema sp. DC36]